MTKPKMEGLMYRYGRRRIGRSFFHKRYFVLESQQLAYYKRKPSEGARQQVALKTLTIDGNCRVEDRGLETHHGHYVYVLSVYNKKNREQRVTMAAMTNQEASAWKEALENVIEEFNNDGNPRIDSHPKVALEIERTTTFERTASSSDRESQGTAHEDDEDKSDKTKALNRIETLGNGIPENVRDWSTSTENINSERAHGARKHWRLVRCQNGLRFFEEIPDGFATTSRYKAMKAVGVVEASCADIFELVMGIDETRYEWDASFHHGSLVETVDGHTAIFYHRLESDWFPTFIWPRDLCYTRYWRRNDDGSYVILFRSKEHPSCLEQPGCVRAHLESGGYQISPLAPRAGGELPRARVQQTVEIDLKGWGVGVLPFCHQHTVIQMLNSVAGLREWFAEGQPIPTQRIVQMNTEIAEARKERKISLTIDKIPSNETLHFDDSEDDDDFGTPHVSEDIDNHDLVSCSPTYKGKYAPVSPDEEPAEPFDLSIFSGTLKRGDVETGRNCWSIPSGHLFRVRSKRFLVDRSKCPAGDPMLQLVAVDWFKDSRRMDHLARRKGCALQVAAEKGHFTIAFNMQVPGSTHYSMVFYFVAKKPIPKGSLLNRFIEGDDSYRNSRLKLIPSVPKGSWIVRQSVGSTPCILGKAVDCSYHRGSNYLEVDVDIGSSTVANGVLGLVFGVVTSLVVDMAFLVQGNSPDELPEHLIGAVRISQLELASAVPLERVSFEPAGRSGTNSSRQGSSLFDRLEESTRFATYVSQWQAVGNSLSPRNTGLMDSYHCQIADQVDLKR
ncbi:unnamed protein product [Calypogeia fissa]